MLSDDRQNYVTASQAHRVMGGFEKELVKKTPLKKPLILGISTKVLNSKKFHEWLSKQAKKPLVGECKTAGFKVMGKDIDECWNYLESIKPTPKIFTIGMETYALELSKIPFVESVITNDFKSSDMERGNEQEYLAIAALEKHLNIKFDHTNEDQEFFKNTIMGCTPDGVNYNEIFMPEIGGEVKCPNQDIHQFNLLHMKCQDDLLKHYPVYYWQTQVGLEVTGAKCWYWASFNESFKEGYQLVVVKITPNKDHIDLLNKRVKRVIDRAEEIKLSINPEIAEIKSA